MNQSQGGIFDPKGKAQEPASEAPGLREVSSEPVSVPGPESARVERQERAQPEKIDFPSLGDGLKRQVTDIERKTKLLSTKTAEEQAVEKVNAQLSGNKDQADFDEASKISEEDIKLAETLLFNGYVEKEVVMTHIPKIKHILCSVTAEEMNLIDEIIYEEAKKFTKPDGTVDMSQSSVQTLRSSLYLALSYKGSNGTDFIKENRILQIEIIKKAMKALSDKYVEGDVESIETFKKSVMDALKKRAARVRQFSTPLLDFLSSKKFDFDNKLFTVMNTEKILPKS